MLHAVPDRPIVRLAAAPAAALIRTFVVAIAIPPAGPAFFLAPTEPDSLLGHVSTTSDARRAALAVARGVLALLPVPSLRGDASPLLIPAFERVPASGDPVQTVDRIVAVPIFTGTPAFDLSHDGWLQWITLAAASSLVYVMVAHAINRVRTYRATIPREVLDSLMSVSSRLRSGALEPRRIHPSSILELRSEPAREGGRAASSLTSLSLPLPCRFGDGSARPGDGEAVARRLLPKCANMASSVP